MAKNYYTTERGNNRNTRYVLLALAILIIGLVVITRQRKNTGADVEIIADQPQAAVQDAAAQTAPLADSAVPPAETPAVVADAALRVPAENTPAVEQAQPPVNAAPVALPIADSNTLAAAPASSADPLLEPAVVALLKEAADAAAAGSIIAARDKYNQSLGMKLTPAVREEVRVQLSKLAGVWLFGREVLPGDTLTAMTVVKPGQRLAEIAKEYKVPFELIQKINGISRPELLQAGKTLKVVNGPLHVVVFKSQFTLNIMLQGVFVKSYKIGLGKEKYETPTGQWLVQRGGKMIKPTWTDPDTGRFYNGDDPDYPLGSRWIALDGIEGAAKGRTGFAIHGTKDPESIGTRASRGCIRLFNGDVIEVYDLLEGGFSEVVVQD